MGKVDFRRLDPRQREAHRTELLATLAKLGLRSDGQSLVRDLLTESEITMIARRMRIAKRLLAGQSFESVVRELKVGMNTIRSVDRWLDRKLPAYRSSLIGLALQKDPRRKKLPLDPLSFAAIRRRYPAHFLLMNILLNDLKW